MKRPRGRPRHQSKPNLEFTQDAYNILEAAAVKLLGRLGLLDNQFITVQDLISEGWERTFFYVKTPEDMKRFMFLHAQAAMARYLKAHSQRPYWPLQGDVADFVPPFDVPSGRELDDPAVSAQLVDEWRHLSQAQRRSLLETIRRGSRPSAVYRELEQRQTVRRLLASRRFTRRDRYIAQQCVLLGRSKNEVARELGVSGERIRQIVRDLRAGRLGRPRH